MRHIDPYEERDRTEHLEHLYPANGFKTNLIVNYLPSEMDKNKFKAFFSSIGPVDSAALMTNDDGTSRCFGFVNYFDPTHAQQAIDTFDGFVLHGKRLKLRYARPGGTRAKCKLFIGNLPTFWTNIHLKYAFEEFGEILELKVLRNDKGRTKRCGFVRYDQQCCAQYAIQARNGWSPPGVTSKLRVHIAHPNTRKQSKRIFMDNGACVTIHHQTSIVTKSKTSDLYAVSPRSRSNNSWAPVPEFQMGISESPHSVHLSSPHIHPTPEYLNEEQTVYMWNLPTFLSNSAVIRILAAYGRIKDVIFHRDTRGESTGCCIATFESRGEAREAVQRLNLISIFNQEVRLRLL